MSLLDFTPEEQRLLKDLIRKEINAVRNNPRSDPDGDDIFPPEVYVALVPSGGIPGRDSAGSGSGTVGDEPGSVECDIFQRTVDGLQRIGESQTVYNLSDNYVEAGWALVIREKFGDWYIAPQGGTADTCESRNEIQDITFIGDPDGGYALFSFIVNAVEQDVVVYWNSTSSYLQSLLEAHPQIGVGNVSVTGGPFPNATVRIEYVGALAGQFIVPPTIDWNGLGDVAGTGSGTGTGSAVDGTGVGVFAVRVQAGFTP